MRLARLGVGAATAGVLVPGSAVAHPPPAAAMANAITGVVKVYATQTSATSLATTPSTVRVQFIPDSGAEPSAVTPTATGAYTFAWPPTGPCGKVIAYATDGMLSIAQTGFEIRYCEGDSVPTLAMYPAGRISGTVTGGAQTVTAIVPGSTTPEGIVSQGRVGLDGYYVLGGLLPGSYLVAFDHRGPKHRALDTDFTTTRQVTFWNNDAVGLAQKVGVTYQAVDVTAGRATLEVNGAVRAGGSTSGRVTCANGAPPSSTTAFARPLDPADPRSAARWPLTGRLNVAPDADPGSWPIQGLTPALAYHVQVDGCAR